jgi:tRNA dimethylallyltransferase
MDDIIVIVGPTGVGKTKLSIELAKKLNAEIINGDSVAIYKNLDIGSAKPTIEERENIPHHLIDIREPYEDFSCADYATLARELIDDIVSRGKTPIFCGGTGLYLNSVLEISSFAQTTKDEGFRAEMEEFARENGNSALHARLAEVDFESAEQIHENNVKRVIRALEIYHSTGKKKSELDALSKCDSSPYDATVFFLSAKNKDALYERIERRVDMMIEDGLVDECKRLYDKGYLSSGMPSSEAIGYKELVPFIEGRDTLESCIARLKLSTRHYAKRQITWFKKNKDYITIYTDEEDALTRALEILK